MDPLMEVHMEVMEVLMEAMVAACMVGMGAACMEVTEALTVWEVMVLMEWDMVGWE